jgi:hypothetical protein
MQIADIGGYRVSFDAVATAAAYAKVAAPGPETCGCWHCRNWIAGRDEIVRADIRTLLTRFGVPTSGEIEVWAVPGVHEPHGYGGWYTVVGQILSSPPESARDFDLSGWRLRFSPDRSYVVPAFTEFTVFEIHFFTEIRRFLEADPE